MKFFEDLTLDIQQAIIAALKKRFRNDTDLKGDSLMEAVYNYINCNNTTDNVRKWVNKYYL
jgi:hypothetical protein